MRFGLAFVIASMALAARVLGCEGTVTLGEGRAAIAAAVPNKPANGACLNDPIIDSAAEGANYGSRERGTNTSDAGLDLDAFEAHLAARSPLAPGPPDRIQKVAACPS